MTKEIPTKEVLVVDDSPEIVDAVVELLRQATEGRYELNIETAFDGQQGCQKLKSRKFDLVFIDMIMPCMLGTNVIKDIRTNEGPNKDTPFMLVSGMLKDLEVKREETPSFEDVYFVDKPFEPEKIKRLVHMWLGRKAA